MPRLVNTAAANRMPSTRCRASACDETSITTASIAVVTNTASRACSSGASGVVRTPDSVPITPVATPAGAQDRGQEMASSWSCRWCR